MKKEDSLSTYRQETPIDDSQLIDKLQAGDAVAWEEFINRFSPKIFEYLKRQLPSEENAQDVLSEVLMGTVQTIKHIESSTNLHTFIYTIVYQKVSDFWRCPISATVPQWLLTKETPLEEVFSQLTDQQQQLILLRYYQGLSLQEIAQVLGKTLRATEILLKLTRAQISQIGGEVAASILPKENERLGEDGPVQPLLAAAYPLLLLQKRLCQNNEMAAEATIFARAQQAIEQMTSNSRNNFLEKLNEYVLSIEQILLASASGLPKD